MAVEVLVKAALAAQFLGLTERQVLELARKGQLPARPISGTIRRTWRFKLFELEAYTRLPFTRGSRVEPTEGATVGRQGTCLTAPFSDRFGDGWIVIDWDDSAGPEVFKLGFLRRV